MSTINWISAFHRLFEVINTDGESYFSGPKFIKTLKPVDYSIPDYTKFIDDRRKSGKSTSRKDFFYDILMSLDEDKRLEAYLSLITSLRNNLPDKVESLKEELKLNVEKTKKATIEQTTIPNDLWNAEKLTDIIEKIDRSITNKDFNRAMTLSYTCLEGLFKAFVKKNIPEKSELNEVNPLAKEVRNFIKDQLTKDAEEIPIKIVLLITTVTNAISSARNGFSESHFSSDAEEWLAVYARDNVNSIAKFVLEFA